MANRERNIRKQVRVTDDEWEQILVKMKQSGTENFEHYARNMLLNGYIVKRDFSILKSLLHELGVIGKNINQIARRVNETRNIYSQDVADLKREQDRIRSLVNQRIVKIFNEDKAD